MIVESLVPVQRAILAELLMTEMDLRHRAGAESIQLYEYLQRFQDDEDLIELAWQWLLSRGAGPTRHASQDPTANRADSDHVDIDLTGLQDDLLQSMGTTPADPEVPAELGPPSAASPTWRPRP